MAFSLEAVFGIDASGVRAEMKSLRKDLNDFVSDYAKLGAGAAIGAFVALSKGAIDLAGHLSDTSQNIGINVESLQALEAQHKRNGVSGEQLEKVLQKIRLGTEKAREGDEASTTALRKLHLTWQELAGLPLDKKYERIAQAQHSATDKAEAYNAVCQLLGDKVGPKVISSMNELAEQTLPKVIKQEREAGRVMSAETIAQLDAAGDAIDDFKRKATVAVGNIIVNFRSEEGLKLLGLQFLKVVGTFGAGIVDAIVEGGELVWAVLKGAFVGTTNYLKDGFLDALVFFAKQWNSILPDFMKKAGFTINIEGIEQLKSAGTGIADEITKAIAQTSPSHFKKDVADYWDKAIHDQQLVVDQLNKVDFGKEATKLRNAGKDIEASMAAGAASITASADALKAASEYVKRNVGEATEANKQIIESATQATATYLQQFAAMPEDMRKAAIDASTQFADSSASLWNIAVEAAQQIAAQLRQWEGFYVKMTRVGPSYDQQSTSALQGVKQRLEKQYYDAKYDQSQYQTFADGSQYNLGATVVKTELDKVVQEMNSRAQAAAYATKYGENAARSQFGDSIVDRSLRDMQSDTKNTATAVLGLLNGLKAAQIIPRV